MKFHRPDLKDRIGCFSVEDRLIRNEPEMVAEAMMGFVVVRAHYCFASRSICYQAYSHLFDKVPEGERAPEYEILVTTLDNHTHVHAERIT